MATIEVDLDEIARSRINTLEKQLTKASLRIVKLEQEVANLRSTKKSVQEALASIRSSAKELLEWNYDD